jgi:hypothetical protein
MSTFFFRPKHMPCTECGASVASDDRDEHDCDPERVLDYRMFQLRHETEAFDVELDAYLDSPRGRFALWYASRNRGADDASAPGDQL